MTGTPEVTVVMPSYCKARFIAEAIESVRKQRFEIFELIIVDDFCPDGSRKICENYAKIDSRIRLIEREERDGVSSARNVGIGAARGEFVAFLDADDLYSPEKLEHQYQAIASAEKPTIAYCNWWKVDEKGERLPGGRRPHPTSSGMIFGDALAMGFGFNMMFMAPKKTLVGAGLFDTALPWSEDYDLLLKLARRHPFIYLDEKLYGYRVYPGNTRNAIERISRLKYEASVLERHYHESEKILSRKQTELVKRRLSDYYSKTKQYGKLVKLGLRSLVT